MDEIITNGPKWTEWTKYTELHRCGLNKLNWTEVKKVDQMDRSRPDRP